MKVLFVTYLAFPLEIGGFQNQVLSIAQNLRGLGHEIIWYTLDDNLINQCDIVQIMSSDPSLLPIIKKARTLGKPVVTTPMVGSRYHSNFFFKFCLKLAKIPLVCSSIKETSEVIKNSDFLLPLSEFEKKRLMSVYNISPSIIEVIPNGISDSYLQTNKQYNNDINYPFDNYLLIVGRIEHNKNQLSLIKAVNKLNLNLIIVGEPGIIGGNEYFQQCKRFSGSNIYYWGRETDLDTLRQLYERASATVIPSFSEMAPIVAFESLSQNTPVVCTKNASISCENINGLFFSDISVGNLCKAIKKAISYNKNLITNKSIYSWLDIARQYEKIYMKLYRYN